jgi:hypothetical protein
MKACKSFLFALRRTMPDLEGLRQEANTRKIVAVFRRYEVNVREFGE